MRLPDLARQTGGATAAHKETIIAPALDPASAPAKILLMIDGMAALSDGGTERQLLQLAGIARQAGLAPTICVLRETSWLTEEAAGCPVAAFAIHSFRSREGLRELWRLLGWMRREHFSILQTFFTDANIIGPLLGRCAGIKVIFGTRRSLSKWVEWPRLPERWLSYLSNRLVTAVLTNAEAVSESIGQFEGIAPNRMTVVYNGVDLEAFHMPRAPGVPSMLGANVRKALHVADDQVLVGNISGLRKIKAVGLFIQAAAEARTCESRLRFVVVGEGPMRPELEALIEEHQLQGVVTLVGAQQDVRPYLAAMDVAVLCSEAEGFSNSLLEYMAAGLPVIATEVGGNREALGAAGLFVPSGDREALAATICRLADGDLRETYSRLSLEQVQRFSLAHAQAAMAAIYQAHTPRARQNEGRARRV